MAINGRTKGACAEREVAKLIQAWWGQLPVPTQLTPDGKPCQFVRTPQSGGWGTAQTRGNYRVAGDVSSTSASWPFTVEAKRREGWTLSVFVRAMKRGSPVWEWWAQCCKAASEEGGVPMLWMRKSRQPWLVLLPESIALPILGLTSADIYWPDPAVVKQHNTTDIHPIGYLASTVLASPPDSWLGLRTASSCPAGTRRRRR